MPYILLLTDNKNLKFTFKFMCLILYYTPNLTMNHPIQSQKKMKIVFLSSVNNGSNEFVSQSLSFPLTVFHIIMSSHVFREIGIQICHRSRFYFYFKLGFARIRLMLLTARGALLRILF